MLGLSFVFLVVAIVAGGYAFADLTPHMLGLARLLLFVFVILFSLAMLVHLIRPRAARN